MLALGVPLGVVAHQTTTGLVQIALTAPFALVGFIVARRQPANCIGWIMLILALLSNLGSDAGEYSVLAFDHGHPGLPLARLAVALTQLWVGLLVLLPIPIVVFPDGRLRSRGWRRVFWAYLAVCVILVAAIAVKDTEAFTDRHIAIDSSGELKSLTASSNGPGAVIGTVVFLLYATLGLSFVVGQLFAYRRSAGERRQQLKWLISGGVVGIVGFAFQLTLSTSHVSGLRALGVIGYLGVIAVPLSIGVGILKYRLYDIDRLISRTLSYAGVTAILVGVYVAVVTLTTRALPLSSPIGVAASTLVVAALFSPLRRRAQRLIDHRFNRARYDADATVAAFASGLRDAVDLAQIQRDLVDVVNRSVQPSHVGVWINAG
ncbi:MAG TPA: hypothetical protein VIL94_05830 [Acidothermaceae bacterium]